MWSLIRLLGCGILTALAVGIGAPVWAGDDLAIPKPEHEEPRSVGASVSPTVAPPVYLFLNTPAELQDLWKKLNQPDFVLISGDEFRKSREPDKGIPAPSPVPTSVVRAVAIRGRVVGEVANLSIELVASVTSAEGPIWLPLQLDNQTVTAAREKGRLLPLEVAPGGGWKVELNGPGEHQVQVDLKVQLRATTDGRSLSLGIPEAPSTQVEIVVDQVVSDAFAGPDDPVAREPVSGGKSTRLASHLSPRSRLELNWRVEAEPGAQLSSLLSIQGEIAIDVDPGAFRARSSWAIKSVRGSIRNLELQLDPEDEVLELTLDGQSIPAGIERVGSARQLSIPLTDPLRPGPTKRLSMTTQRKLPPQSTARLSFHGFPLSHAKEQSGAIGIAQSGNMVISPTVGRGLRRIDPRTELPADLRARPATFLAYQFVDQPFDLDLRIEPSPPLVHFDARTTISLGAQQAKIDTWLGADTANGRLFDLNINLPPGLELESVGPPEFVESWQVSANRDEGRLMTARLTFRAQEASSFNLHLVGRQAIDPSRPTGLALFQPLDSTLGGGRIAVLTERNLTVDLVERTEGGSRTEVFRSARQEPPADWAWPAGRSSSDAPALWLRYDGSPATLPLRMVVHPRAVMHETSLAFQVGRRGVDGRQETEFTVHFGTLESVDVDVPPELVNRWEIEDGDIATRTNLGPTPSGGRLFRLKFANEVTDRSKLTFRFRRTLATELEPDQKAEVDVPWLRFDLGEAAPVRARVTADPGIRVEVLPGGWQRASGEDSTATTATLPPQYRLLSTRAESATTALRLNATALTLTPLPSLVASRLWLRTVQGPDYDLRTTAWYWIESHESTLSVSLPDEAILSRVRIGGVAVDRKETLPGSKGYRFRFPPQAGPGPWLAAFDYVVPSRYVREAWTPPRLLNGIVQQTRWEVVVPTSREVVGVPAGWTDENQWYWGAYSWKRRPWKSTEDLASWASGATSRTAGSSVWDEDNRADYHAYLFEHPGQPPNLRLFVASRGTLVALCSGPVLGLGVLMVVYRRVPFRMLWVMLTALALAILASTHPSLTIQMVQSAMVGVVFTLLAAVLQRMIDRPRPGSTVFGEPAHGHLGDVVHRGSSVNQMGFVGSDDSTAIRVRQISTVDHVITDPSLTPESATRKNSPRNSDTLDPHPSPKSGP